MGWFAIRPAVSWQLLLLCLLIAIWLPLHLWSVMIANREDYLGAGITYFPLNQDVKGVVKILFALSLLLYGLSVALYFTGDFALLYLLSANLLGAILVYGSWNLVTSISSRNSWRLYKLSAFPYLGLIFLFMCLGIWV